MTRPVLVAVVLLATLLGGCDLRPGPAPASSPAATPSATTPTAAAAPTPGDRTERLLIPGTADPLVPYGGGDIEAGRQEGPVIGAPQTALLWAELHGCDPEPEVEALPEVDPADGTSVRVERSTGCAQGRAVELHAIVGGGHGWPGGMQPDRYLPGIDTGVQTGELDATEVTWAFFSAQG